MKVVLDVSAAAEILFEKPGSKKLSSIVENSELVTAPNLFVVEATNLVFKYYRDKIIKGGEESSIFNKCLSFIDLFIPNEELAIEALSMACDNNKPVYDYYYLVLARRNSARLLTLDKVLLAEAKKHGVKV